MQAMKSYKLFASAKDGKAPCAFFHSEKGCRNGANCKFSHEVDGNLDAARGQMAETGSVVSSESSNDSEGLEVKQMTDNRTPTAIQPHTKESEGTDRGTSRKNRRSKDDTWPFLARGSPTKRAKMAEHGKAHVVALRSNSMTNQLGASHIAPYQNLHLPIASFSLMADGPHPNATPAAGANTPKSQTTTTSGPDDLVVPEKKLVLPKSTPVGRQWAAFVQNAHQHPRYASAYNMIKYQELDEAAGIGSRATAWIRADPYGAWCATNPAAIAIDCEMCETSDPVSGQIDPRALCRLSVIDATTDETLIDTLVKPAWPVTDYRTRINGIAAEHLDNVQFTLRHAQAFMRKLCSEETVMIGHALHNDLAALRMEHDCVVDSAMLFAASDHPTASVSLRDLAQHVLQVKMPHKHDSVNDAKTALQCVRHYVEQEGKVEPVVRASTEERKQKYEEIASTLFVHRIPGDKCKKAHLFKLFLTLTSINPLDIGDIEYVSGNQAFGKTMVSFRSPAHAELAFATLEDTAEPDNTGRMQKRVFLQGGGYIRVRKNAYESKHTNAVTNESASSSAASEPPAKPRPSPKHLPQNVLDQDLRSHRRQAA